jgi:tetratricopeptide (TPR) repeat protein
MAFGYGRDGEHAKAAEQAQKALDLSPGDVRGLLILAGAEFELHNYAAAGKAWLAVLATSPQHVDANYGMAQVRWAEAEERPRDTAAARQKYTEAAAFADAALAAKPDHFMALLLRGFCLVSLGDRETGLNLMEQGVKCRPESAESHRIYARALLRVGEREKAIDQIRAAIETAGGNEKLRKMALEDLDHATREGSP